MTATVGVIGVGRMGIPVCTKLVRAGFTVVAGDQRPERKRDVRAAGAGWMASTQALAATADVLLTILPGPAELREAMAQATELSSCGPARHGST